MAKRITPGNVFLLKLQGGGVAYLQYAGRHAQYGDGVLVSHKLPEPVKVVTNEVFSDGYVTFYPVKAAVAQGLIELADALPAPEFPSRLRRPGARSGRRVDTWIIESAEGETVKSKLSAAELRLPIAVIWNHALLVQRIEEGWNPAEHESTS